LSGFSRETEPIRDFRKRERERIEREIGYKELVE